MPTRKTIGDILRSSVNFCGIKNIPQRGRLPPLQTDFINKHFDTFFALNLKNPAKCKSVLKIKSGTLSRSIQFHFILV